LCNGWFLPQVSFLTSDTNSKVLLEKVFFVES